MRRESDRKDFGTALKGEREGYDEEERSAFSSKFAAGKREPVPLTEIVVLANLNDLELLRVEAQVFGGGISLRCHTTPHRNVQ